MKYATILTASAIVLLASSFTQSFAGSPYYTSDSDQKTVSDTRSSAQHKPKLDVGGYPCSANGMSNGAVGGDAASIVSPGFTVGARAASCQ